MTEKKMCHVLNVDFEKRELVQVQRDNLYVPYTFYKMEWMGFYLLGCFLVFG